MPKFRTKPVVKEAERIGDLLHAAAKRWSTLPLWVREAYEKGDVMFYPGTIAVRTLEGTLTAEADHWLIRGVNGELYPCAPDVFEKTYESVKE